MIAKDYYQNLIYCLEQNATLIAKTKNIYRFYDENYDSDIFTSMRHANKGYTKDLSKNLAYKTEPWRAVFDISLFATLRFPPIRKGEDVPFGICANALSPKVAFCKSAIYFYRNRLHSLSNNLKTHLPKAESFDFSGFDFVVDFFKQHKLLKYRIPVDMIRPSYQYLLQNPAYFTALKKQVQSCNLDSAQLANNPTLQIILQCNNAEEYISKTATFKEYWKMNFRLKFNKREKILKLFGKTILSSKQNIDNKWND